jgi:NADH-quinone oxidoreductase subunit H
MFFFGGYYLMLGYTSLIIFIWKIIFCLMTFVWVRGSLPRYRYDQLMRLGWKVLLPISLGAVLYWGAHYYLFVIDLEFVK